MFHAEFRSRTAVPQRSPVPSVLMSWHARVHASVHEMWRDKASRCLSAGAARGGKAPVVVSRLFRGSKRAELPKESRTGEGSPSCPDHAQSHREPPSNDLVPARAPLRGLQRVGHRRVGIRPSFWQDGRRRDADRARQYMDSHLWRDAQLRGSVRKLSSPKDRRAMARNRETADPSITSASRTAASRSAGQKTMPGLRRR